MKSALFLSERPQNTKPGSTSIRSGTDWLYLLDSSMGGTPTENHPEADPAHIVRGVVRRNLKPVSSDTGTSERPDRIVIG
uniref:Uncharacterized protein n=1 Tax=Candidatus Kentrum sp. FW TaxID=2126338 RepID=A0A450TAJ2_9GAMM|nr:MAG: hypothetical protein BECKFW1821B_GA0114236_10868 [Candidatus Kentron sp. FW]